MTQASDAAVIEAGPVAVERQGFLFGSRTLDFWLIGGLSILCWIPLYAFQNSLSGISNLTYNISWIAFFLAYFINYPHFMASYKLAYTQGGRFVADNWFQLILVPVLMVVIVLSCLVFWSADLASSGFAGSVNSAMTELGLGLRIGRYNSFGAELLAWMVMFMFFTVGWHYSKQTFGCMMVYAKFDRYPLTTLERNLIRYSLLSTWWVTWLNLNTNADSFSHYGLTIHNLGLPRELFTVSLFIVVAMFALLLAMMVRKFVTEGHMPSATFLVPMIALVLWHVPLFSNPHYFYFIPMFHSLQYLPFVAKVESTRYRKRSRLRPTRRLGMFFAIMVAIGYLSFDLVPTQLDVVADARAAWGFSFFIIAFLSFINIHHYFIDNVLWRFRNPEVRDYLLDTH